MSAPAFVYLMAGIGVVYLAGFAFATYLAIRHDMPVFGIRVPPRIPSKPEAKNE